MLKALSLACVLSIAVAVDLHAEGHDPLKPAPPQVHSAGERIAAYFERGAADFLENVAFDKAAFRKLVLAGVKLKVDPDALDGAIDGFLESVFGAMIQVIENESQFRFLRSIDHGNGDYRLLFRTSRRSIAYTEFIVRSDPKNPLRVRILDAHSWTLGQRWSEVFKTFALPSVLKISANLSEDELKEASPWLKYSDDIQLFTKLVRNESFHRADSVYRKLPKLIQSARGIRMHRLSLLFGLGREKEYKKALADLKKDAIAGPTADLLSLDLLFFAKDYSGALAAIDRIDKLVGDPYLNLFRANLSIAEGDPKKARKQLLTMIRADPTNPDGYYVLIEMYLADENWRKVTSALLELWKKTHYGFGDLTDYEDFAKYRKTKEYPRYLKKFAEIGGEIEE